MAEALTVDEASRTITVRAVATGNTESTIHLLVNNDGSNAESAFFTTEATTLDYYNALVALGGIPGNNLTVEDDGGNILGSGLDVKATIDGTEYGCYDLITASEVREMDARFGGNIVTNQEFGTGCLLCMESCPAGISSNASYEYQANPPFAASDKMPAEGSHIIVTYTVQK